MPGQGPLTGNSFNVGRDITLQIVINGQNFSNLGLVTDTSRKSLSHMHEVVPTNNDGQPVRRTTFSGYEFQLHLSRQNGQFDSLVRALQDNYFNGGTPPKVTMTETIRNPDNSVNQTVYTGGTIVPESMGAFKGADGVNDITFQLIFTKSSDVGGASPQAVNLGAVTFNL